MLGSTECMSRGKQRASLDGKADRSTYISCESGHESRVPRPNLLHPPRPPSSASSAHRDRRTKGPPCRPAPALCAFTKLCLDACSFPFLFLRHMLLHASQVHARQISPSPSSSNRVLSLLVQPVLLHARDLTLSRPIPLRHRTCASTSPRVWSACLFCSSPGC